MLVNWYTETLFYLTTNHVNIIFYFEQKVSHARWGAAYCSRIIFPFSHVSSRYVSLLACGDEKEEVREEGKKGLSPNQDNPNEDRLYPDFPPMTQYIYTRVSKNLLL